MNFVTPRLDKKNTGLVLMYGSVCRIFKEVLKKALWDTYMVQMDTRMTTEYTVSSGDVGVLRYAFVKLGYPMDYFICRYAARHGQLEVLKWARANG